MSNHVARLALAFLASLGYPLAALSIFPRATDHHVVAVADVFLPSHAPAAANHAKDAVAF